MEEKEKEKKEKFFSSKRVATRVGASSGAGVARGLALEGVINVEKEQRVALMTADLAKYKAKWPADSKLQVYIRGEAFTVYYSEQGGQWRDWSSTPADGPWRGTAYTIEQVSTRVERLVSSAF
jgi:hypothetical protein